MTVAMRLSGFAQGLIDREKNAPLIGMLEEAASLLLLEWNDYAEENNQPRFNLKGDET
jgi:hypothetical protein